MKTSWTTMLALAGAAVLMISGCAAIDSPGPQSDTNGPGYSASPATSGPDTFTRPYGDFERRRLEQQQAP